MLHKILANFSVNLGCRLLVSIVFVSIMMTTNTLASPCSGQVAQNRDTAQNNFRASCGQEWDDKLRHQCTWVDNPTSGWICHEYAPNGLAAAAPEDEDAAPPAEAASLSPPFPIHAQVENDFVSVVWRKDAGAHGVNVYRNNQWLASVNYPGTVYNDYTGQSGDSYYLTAYDSNNNFSARSVVFLAVISRAYADGNGNIVPSHVTNNDEWQEVTDQRPSGPDDITSTDGWQPVTNTNDTEEGSPGNPYGDSSGFPGPARGPTNVGISVQGPETALFTWNNPPDQSSDKVSIRIYNYDDNDNLYFLNLGGRTNRLLVDNLKPNTSYRLNIHRHNSHGSSPWIRIRFRTPPRPY